MPNQPTTPAERFKILWPSLERADRRRILRAVNRMHALEDPTDAVLAVELAKRQRRLWTRWWWVVPALGGLMALPDSVEAALGNALFGTVFVGLLAAAFSWRAGRSIKLNQAVVEAAAASRKRPARKRKRGGGGKRRRR